MATVSVKNAAGATVTLEAPNANGRAGAANSRPVVLATEDKAALDAIVAAIEGMTPGGGAGGDASAANQDAQTTLLTAINTKLGVATYYPATQPVSGNVGITGSVAVTGPLTDAQLRATALPVSGTFWQATQPVSIAGTVAVSGPLTDTQLRATAVPVSVSGSVAVTGPLTDTQLRATALPVSAAALPLPAGAATSAKQDTQTAAVQLVGTRAYGTSATRVAYSGTSAQSAAITGSEVLLHNCGTARCFVKSGANPTATANDIPLEAGEKFHLRITTGDKVAVLQDTAAGNLNVVPVA